MKFITLILMTICFSREVLAWGKQGHAIINQTAALVLADSTEHEFLREHAYDLSYFSNVPDIAWKQEKTNQVENPQHYMDLEVFERELKIQIKASPKKGVSKPPEAFLLDREEFDTRYPNISAKAGRAWWRIREIADLLQKQSQFLADSKLSMKERHELQAHWLVLAGVLGHYIGDLSQPLHLTENFDGQLSSQKGIHSHFEDKMVNLLIPKIEDDILASAKKQWPAFTKRNQEFSTLTLAFQLSQFSRSNIKALLALDKKQKRKKSVEQAKAYKKIIVSQMTQASLTLAEIWRRNLDWKFNGQSFYTFIAIPEYILPGTSHSAHIEEFKVDK